MGKLNPFFLDNKTVLVTGASSGIGRATAVLCSQMGATVVITGRNEERLNETFLMLEDPSRGHLQVIADLATEEGINNLVEQLPKLDGVACNAGICKGTPVQFYSKTLIDEVFAINIMYPMLLIKNLTKKKLINKSGSIVFTSSAGGTYVSAGIGNGIYGATKGAIDGFLKSLSLELASKGIRCNSVNPGMVETPLIKGGAISDEQLKEDAKRYPLGRYGQPEDIANAIVFLLSDDSSWITGTELKIDGGSTL